MRRCFLFLAIVFLQILFKLRYSIRYKGLEEIRNSLRGSAKGALFLSNHPAIFLDGLMVGFPLLKSFDVHPLVIESTFFSPLSAPFVKWIRALPVPNFGRGSNSIKLYRLRNVLQEVRSGLREGEHYLIYPAGMTKQTGREVLGGAFAVHDILEEVTDCPVVLIRIVGLWGSRFSRAQNKGDAVDWVQALKNSFLDVVKAAFFFLPRRKVEITFELAKGLPRQSTRSDLNRWLEGWFNAPFEKEGLRGEPLTLVSYSPWRHEVPDLVAKEAEERAHISPELKEKVFDWISEHLHISKESISFDSHLIADLGMDSLSLAELITYLESEMGAPRIFPDDISTVASLMLATQGKLKPSAPPPKEWDTKAYFQERKKQRVLLSKAKTIPDQFFKTADSNLFRCIAADDKVGPLSYRQLKRSLLIAAYHIQKRIAGKRVGILLPDMTAAHVLTLACQIAGKTPVLLNWTIGGKSMKTVADLSGIEQVLTSYEFLDLLENVDLSPIQEKILFLEEFKASFSFLYSFWLTALSYLPFRYAKYSSLFPHWKRLNEQDEAVLLFTSGTESEPKGVPLTHRNILLNLQGALEAIPLYSTDRLMSILPPFHSFGFAVTGLMPLLSGLPVYFFPNPTDGGAIADKMRVWRSTLICSAPSFLKNVFLHAKKEPFQELRLIVSGAEKAGSDFFEAALEASPNALVTEGYGITECSPILTFNTAGRREEGVGKPLRHVSLRIVDPENYAVPKALLEDGMILATGPTIFSGYLQTHLPSPFYNEQGTRWYVTGDLGHLTSEGSLVITGRLKRFVKIGGEMISLAAIEEGLMDRLKDSEEEPSCAVIALEETPHTPKLVLVAKKEISLTEANLELRRKGFSNLIRLDKVLKVKSIPVTATGKVSLRELAALAKESYRS